MIMKKGDSELPEKYEQGDQDGEIVPAIYLGVLHYRNGNSKLLTIGDTITDDASFVMVGLYTWNSESGEWEWQQDICAMIFI